MASMRRLNRRLARWNRYARRYNYGPIGFNMEPPTIRVLRGHWRAWNARQAEIERRFWDETPEIWLGGPAGEAALIADDEPGCTLLPSGVSACYCTGRAGCQQRTDRCPYCDSKTCAGDCDEAFADEDDGDPWPPGVVTEHAGGGRG